MTTRKHATEPPSAPEASALSPIAPTKEALDAALRIVGIGASAGGLEAFEQLFRSMPAVTGLAFVLVPHLDPTHASILTEILQRCTTMPVVEALDQVVVAADALYVIPPNRDMGIFHGRLQLSEPELPRGQRMPIDAFLRSLAEDQGENAVGVILSGTGTDGTLGLRAILGAGGVTLVQEPAMAKYDGMPTSAIRAGYATHVLPVDKMPDALLAIMRRLPVRSEHGHPVAPAVSTAKGPDGLNRILLLLRTATGHDFSLYKKSTLRRRIERRMVQHDVDDMDIYGRYLKENPAEAQMLFKEMLINVSSFFRDPEAFAALKQDILPQLLAAKPEGYVFRVWVAGCASGEEAYSIAILLREFLDETNQDFKIQLYATDLDEDAVALARAGCYPPNIAADLTAERLHRWFIKDDTGYRVKKEIREMVVFAVQNVIKDPPFTKLDLLSCRNLMIYLEPELQDRLLPAFHYALRPDGILFLSPSESIGGHPELFAAVNRKWKFYRAVHSDASIRALVDSVPSWTTPTRGKAPEQTTKAAKEINFAELARRALLQSYAPASVVADAKGNILYVQGDTGKYLRPAPGQATLNVVDMAREGLQLDLRSAVHAAANNGAATLGREVSVKTNGDFQTISLSVRPLVGPDASQGLLLVSFQDVARPQPARLVRGKRGAVAAAGRRVEELERDLAYTRENLQATIEEQQSSNEELQSTNEELQSTNEELQSTNEEMETSKEELQSVNEELVTVNAELQTKIEQLAGMQNDMKNLLDNFSVGTIFIDEHLVIRRFTREAVQIYPLVESDIGRPLADIKSNLEGEDLLAQAQTVLDTLVPCEREVSTVGGAKYLARLQPYRTIDNVINGVVLAFTNVTARAEADAKARAARLLADNIIDTVREPLVVLDAEMKVISASRAFYRRFRFLPKDVVGRCLYELGNGQWDIPALRELLDKLLPQDQILEDFAMEEDFPVIGHCRMLLNARRIVTAAGQPPLILLAMEEAAMP